LVEVWAVIDVLVEVAEELQFLWLFALFGLLREGELVSSDTCVADLANVPLE
jgi:hypothetical protein